MVLGVLGSLGAKAIRGLAQNLFPAFYDRGISANQALRELRELGLGYRRQDFLRDFAQGLGRYDQETKIKFVNPLGIPSEGILQSYYHGVPDKYSFVFKATGLDMASGEESTQYFFIHRNTLDRKANLENEAYDYISSQSERYGIETFDVSVVEGFINPVWA